jgi:hypothetical protein
MRNPLPLIFILFVVPFIALSQTDQEKEIKAAVWGNPTPEFKNVTVPEKWKNESAVTLATSMDYVGDYATKMTGLTSVAKFYVEMVTWHHRVKLQDLASVKEFSKLSFDEGYVHTNMFGRSNSYFFVGVKVIKPNGTEKEVDLSKAVASETGSDKDYKIAVPDLEPGDIIDYYSASKRQNLGGIELYDYLILEEKYPIVKRTIRIKIPHDFRLVSKALNGAPDFKYEKVERDYIYTMADTMRDKTPKVLWAYRHRCAPELRYRKVSENSGLNIEGDINRYLGSFDYNVADIGTITDFMRKNFKDEKDEEKLVKELYYLLRNPIYMKALFGMELGKPLDVNYVPDGFFAYASKYLIKSGIDHQVMVVPNRDYGDIKDLVSFSHVDAVIRVNRDPQKPIYLQRITPFAMPGEVPYLFEGMSGLLKRFKSKGSPDQNTIEKSKAEDNLTTTVLKIELDKDNNSKLNVKREVTSGGFNKEYHQYTVVTNYDYLKEYDQPKYQAYDSRQIKGILQEYNKEKQKYEQRMVQDYNDRDKKIKDDLEEELGAKISDYKNFKLKSIGMWDDRPFTEYSDEYSIDNFVKKAGPNYILELSKLIEKQTVIEENEKKRDKDIYMAYARMYVYDITFSIPEGYSIEGFDNLNKKFENNTGGFVSTATMEGNVLKIKTKKYYTDNYFPVSEWPKMLEFVNAALDFTNLKVLLKKK